MKKIKLSEIVTQKLKQLEGFLIADSSEYDNDSGEFKDRHSLLDDCQIDADRLIAKFDEGKKDKVDPELFGPKIEKEILQKLKIYLQANPERNSNFKEKTDWKVLNQLLTVVRLKELSRVKIIKRGGRGKGLNYDASDLAKTFFGRKILKGQGLGRRRILKADELDKVKQDCARLKLELPEIVEPTTTEKFFQTK